MLEQISPPAADLPQAVPSVATVEPDGTVHTASIRLPLSPVLSAQARVRMVRHLNAGPVNFCPSEGETWDEARERLDATFFRPVMVGAMERYACDIEDTTLADVGVHIVRPRGARIRPKEPRAIIHMHAGGFVQGARFIPDALALADAMGIEVISVDYRLPPEWELRKAAEDVLAVYRAILQDHDPGHVGIWGTSGGGDLAAIAMAMAIDGGEPVAGALGLIAAAGGFFRGDSSYIAPDLMANTVEIANLFAGDDENFRTMIGSDDPQGRIIGPMYHLDVLARFPPTFLASSMRAAELSSTLVTHRNLINAGNTAELHVWEGLPHAFNIIADLPESQDLHNTLARFFQRHLGGRA